LIESTTEPDYLQWVLLSVRGVFRQAGFFPLTRRYLLSVIELKPLGGVSLFFRRNKNMI